MSLVSIVSDFSHDHDTANSVDNGNVMPIVRHASPDDPFFIPAVYDEPRSVESESWRAKAFTDLRIWLNASSDKQKTVEAWAAVYIRCGACYRGWQDWIKANPPDRAGWIESAVQIITEKRWI